MFASIPEIYTLRQVYKKSPVLYSKIQCLLDDDTSMIDKTPSFTQAWRIYFKQNLLFASIACGMLYANILSSGSIMTQYLVSNEIPLSQIGGFHGLGALFGIFGTLIWSKFRNLSKSLSRAGECSIVAFAIMMCLCGLVFVLNIDSTTRVYVMMISVAVLDYRVDIRFDDNSASSGSCTVAFEVLSVDVMSLCSPSSTSRWP